MSMDRNRLWAKSKRDEEPERPSMFLPGHLADVHEAAQKVLEATADDQLRALGLKSAEYRDRFRRIVLLAAVVHDLGKANDHFQGMILGTRNIQENPQGIRHEWVSVLMLKQIRDWLLPALAGGEHDFAIVEWAVSGHHPAVSHCSPPRECPARAGADIALLLQSPDYLASLLVIKNKFRLGDLPKLINDKRNLVGSGNVFDDLTVWRRGAQQLWEKMKRTPDCLLVAAAKIA